MQESPLYNRWATMKHRCYHDNSINKHWNGKGITVCAEWKEDFLAFEVWSIENGYHPGLSLDRVDVDGDYEPSNCEWVTRSVNSIRARAEYNMVRKNHISPIEKAAHEWVRARQFVLRSSGDVSAEAYDKLAKAEADLYQLALR